MELIALAQAEGEAVACAYGCTREGETVRAGLLFVQAGLTDREQDFENPQTQTHTRLRLPEKTLGLAQEGYLINATLEAL